MWVLINRKKDLGKYSASISKNIIYGIIVLFTVYVAILGIIGILDV
jgi:hypothetical protein